MRFVWLCLPVLLCSSDSFITQSEYAQMLYQNPRGIGCNHCHGEKGEGRTIARYRHKNEKKILKAPAINALEYHQFYAALNGKHTTMPKYFLTDEEIRALYHYVTAGK